MTTANIIAAVSACVSILAMVVSIMQALNAQSSAIEANRISVQALEVSRNSGYPEAIETRSRWYIAYDAAKTVLTEANTALVYIIDNRPDTTSLSRASAAFPGPLSAIGDPTVTGVDLELASRLVPIRRLFDHDPAGLVYNSPDIFTSFRSLNAPVGTLLVMMREGRDISVPAHEAGHPELGTNAPFVDALHQQVADLLVTVSSEVDKLYDEIKGLHAEPVLATLMSTEISEEEERLAIVRSAVARWSSSHGGKFAEQTDAIVEIAELSGWSLAYQPRELHTDGLVAADLGGQLVWLGQGGYSKLRTAGMPARINEEGVLLSGGSDDDWRRYIYSNFDNFALDYVAPAHDPLNLDPYLLEELLQSPLRMLDIAPPNGQLNDETTEQMQSLQPMVSPP